MGINESISAAVQRDVPFVGQDESLRSAIVKMADSAESAIIVKNGEDLVGVVTDMDLMSSVVDGDDLDSTPVARFMTACELITKKAAKIPCVQLDEGESIKNALDIMYEAGVHHLLVSGGSDDEVIGMVSAKSLLKIAAS